MNVVIALSSEGLFKHEDLLLLPHLQCLLGMKPGSGIILKIFWVSYKTDLTYTNKQANKPRRKTNCLVKPLLVSLTS